MDPYAASSGALEAEAQDYISSKGIGPLVEGLMKALIEDKPDDPVAFLIDKLENGTQFVRAADSTCTTLLL